MTDVRQQLDGRPAGVALVTTPTGGWLLGWDPQLATFTAGHVSETAARGAARFDRELGSTRATYPSPATLEEGLGFALPSPVRAALEAERDAHPALAAPRGMELGVGALPAGPRDVGTFPVWSSPAVAGGPDGGSVIWGLAVEQDRLRHAAAVDLGHGTFLEVLGARPEPASGSALVSYRLSHAGRVVLAGDDVRAPAGVDPSADDSVRALLAVVVDPDPAHRPRLLSAGQRAFLEAHGERLLDAAAGPSGPYPRGARVAVDVDGQRHLGSVLYPVTSREGEALAYAWVPDVASLIGHPWRRNGLSGEGEADRTLITPAAKVTPTLTGPEIGAPGPGEALAFGAVVAIAHPGTGKRVEATVLRAFPGGGNSSVVYQVEPHTLDNTEPITVATDQVALVRGTWWPSPADLMAARQSAGLAVVTGEILPGNADDPQMSFFAPDSPEASQRNAVTPEVTAAQRDAALLVGLDPVPRTVTIDILGELARVGDPDHGWLVVPKDDLMRAMAKPIEQLGALLATDAPDVALTGNESLPTLAALAVRHSPDRVASTAPLAAVAEPARHLRVVRDKPNRPMNTTGGGGRR
jgi:hypothetical protein